MKKNKFGFFERERDIFREVATVNGLLRLSDSNDAWCRHPLAFLVEAADTISYSCIDIEDGFHLGYVPFEKVKHYLLPLASKVVENDPCKPEEELAKIMNDEDRVGFLRSRAINNLLHLALEVFRDKYSEIMRGTFDEELTDVMRLRKEFEVLKSFNKVILYDTAKGVQIEVAGYTILGGLLEYFLQAVESPKAPNERRSRKIMNLIQEHLRPNTDDNYLNVLRICDFVSGMTDDYAVDIYRKLTGSRLPIID